MKSLNTFVRTLQHEVKSLTFLRILEILIVCVFSIALIRDTYYVGNDFQVFYKTARYFIDGISIYDLSHAREMVFKYPPWVFPLFLPFGFVPYPVAALVWGVVQVASLFVIGKNLFYRGAHPWALRIGFTVFWGLWAVHALDGQIMIPLLAFGLVFFERASSSKWIAAAFGFLFSVKIFSVFAIVPLLKKVLAPRALGVLGLFVLCGTAVTYSGSPMTSVRELFDSWAKAASSGNALMDGEKTRGRENQGLPVLVLRVLKTPLEDSMSELTVTAVVTLVLLVFGVWVTRGLLPVDQFFIWLALCPAVHPLSWFHGFTWVFPLVIMLLNLSMRERKPAREFLIALGIACVCLITQKTLGDFGKVLELLSIKSIGVLLLVIIYSRSRYMSR